MGQTRTETGIKTGDHAVKHKKMIMSYTLRPDQVDGVRMLAERDDRTQSSVVRMAVDKLLREEGLLTER